MKKKVSFMLITILIINLNYVFSKTEVYFSPNDQPTKRLIEEINNAKRKIYAAVYMITDKNIAVALSNAKKRKVDVIIITDKISIDSSYGKGSLLQMEGVPVLMYNPYSYAKRSSAKQRWTFNGPIMHNKFAILDNKVWTGSFNWTRAANQLNQENVIITDDKQVLAAYSKQFDHLKALSVVPTKTRKIEQTNILKHIREFLHIFF